MQEANTTNILAPGTTAPDFTLSVTPDQRLSLRDLRGRPVILAFYPADWSPVCGDQMALYNEILPEFRRLNAELLGISVDGGLVPRSFYASAEATFPIAGRLRTEGAVAQKYGAYRRTEGVAERALFVIDHAGIIQWSYCSPIAINPGADGIIEALERLRK